MDETYDKLVLGTPPFAPALRKESSKLSTGSLIIVPIAQIFTSLTGQQIVNYSPTHPVSRNYLRDLSRSGYVNAELILGTPLLDQKTQQKV